MPIQVFSEIGRLRRVLLHRPGREIDWMVPSMMERLLFDDILDGERAREEHDSFRRVLESAGVEVLDPERLLAECLAAGEVKSTLFSRLEHEHGVPERILLRLDELEPALLATTLVTGIRTLHERPDGSSASLYHLPPVPNYFFQRDPQIVLGDRVLISSMATEAREREPLLSATVFAHHPKLARRSDHFQLWDPTTQRDARVPTIEGGDLLVATPEILLVGLSERTNRRGIEALAVHLRERPGTFKHILVVELPRRRSTMHLDTVFTFIDRGTCLAYLPVIDPGGSEAGHVYRIDVDAPHLAYAIWDGLVHALADLGVEVELVPCGGPDVIDQQREQWTDGANAFAVAPGVITVYRRNRCTAEELARRGWRVIAEEDVIAGRAEVLGQGPTLVTLGGDELSRARGGARCMTMPLERDPLDGRAG